LKLPVLSERMRIDFDRYFNFYTHTSQNWLEVELIEPARLRDVLAGLGIPIAEVHLAVINGEAIDPQEIVITNQDTIKLFPPFGGG
jgi:sulfur carrier protein ThiS